MLYLFNQSEDFTMIKLKLTPSHLCAHDAPCERSGWTSLIQHGEKKEKKKTEIITRIVSPPNHEGLQSRLRVSLHHEQHFHLNV